MLVNLDRMSNDEIYAAIVEGDHLSGRVVDDHIWDVIESVIGKRKTKMKVEPVEPLDGPTEVSGKVMEFNNTINIYSRLKYDASNSISASLLGELAKNSWAFARIRSNPDRQNRCLEFEVLIDKDYLSKNPLRLNNHIVGIAKAVHHPKGIIWQLAKHDVY